MSTPTLAPTAMEQKLQTPRWRVHETGRVMHLLVDGLARCGEPGSRWRTVAGIPTCPDCVSGEVRATNGNEKPAAPPYNPEGDDRADSAA